MSVKLKYRPPRRMPSLSLVVLVGVAVVLLILAVLQYRWITEISEAEQNRLKENLTIATTRFADDFERELMPLVLPARRLGGPGPNQQRLRPPEFSGPQNETDRLIQRYDRWISTSHNPELLQDLFYVKVTSPDDVQLFRFNPEARGLNPSEWPVELTGIRERLTGGPEADRLAIDQIPSLIIPIIRPAGFPGPQGFRALRRREYQPEFGVEIIRLDKKAFTESFLPFLVQRHFAKQGDFDYDILIAQAGTNEVVYHSSPGLTLADLKESKDATVRLVIGGEGGRGPRIGPPLEPRPPDARPGRGGPPGGGTRGWQLYAKHHAGSLQSFTDQFRRRNLLISFGVLAILATGVAFTFWSSERVRAVGKLQLEFAAGLSHELRTPLAVIRSAGYNLATGNVSGKDDVSRYGQMLQEQGLRLSDMVEQALLFAQTQSGRKRYERSPVALREVIEKSIGSCRGILPSYPSEFVVDVASDLPMALTDAHALGHCLHNLLVNALKYGSTPGSIGITAQASQTSVGNEIQLIVDNKGPVIDPADLHHIFEPFFRGKNTGNISGSGLGLYIVKSIMESLGGRVTVSSTESSIEAGTRFTLHIPSVA